MANAKMRQTLELGGMVVAPGAYDIPTARLMQQLGFEALYVGGSQTGTVLGTTEPLTTVTQMADVGRTVARACREEMPVILDAGAGFGDPVHVMYTVEVLEAAGVTAIHIEDQFFPKRVSYHRGLEHVVPIGLTSFTPFRGVQFTVGFDASVMIVDSVKSAGRVPFSAFFEQSIVGDAGEVEVVLVDFGGDPISEGSGVVVNIYTSVSASAAVQDMALAISGAEVADENGNPVDIVVQDGVLRIR